MQSSSVKRVVAFVAISLVLVLAVVGGMRWAKQRAISYANQQAETTAQTSPQSQSQPQQQDEGTPQPPTAPAQAPAETPTPQSTSTPIHTEEDTPAIVPATGPQETILAITSLSFVTFAAVRYVQARRNLLSLR